MAGDAEEALSLLRQVGELKREAARVIAAIQLGGDRRKRRELARRMETCRRRAKALSAEADGLLREDLSTATREELEAGRRFLQQLQTLGGQETAPRKDA